MTDRATCDHSWAMDEAGFYCSICGQRESVHTFLADLDARRHRDWRAVAGRPVGTDWVHGLADAIEGGSGPVSW